MARIHFMNTEIGNVTMEEALQALDDLIQKRQNAFVVMQDPKKLMKRYLIDDMKIFGLAWKYKRKKRNENDCD